MKWLAKGQVDHAAYQISTYHQTWGDILSSADWKLILE